MGIKIGCKGCEGGKDRCKSRGRGRPRCLHDYNNRLRGVAGVTGRTCLWVTAPTGTGLSAGREKARLRVGSCVPIAVCRKIKVIFP